jgi:hypothetical protein
MRPRDRHLREALAAQGIVIEGEWVDMEKTSQRSSQFSLSAEIDFSETDDTILSRSDDYAELLSVPDCKELRRLAFILSCVVYASAQRANPLRSLSQETAMPQSLARILLARWAKRN